MADNLAHSIVARWDHPDVKFVPLLREGGIQAVVVTSSNDAFADACRSAGIQIIPAGALQFADWKTLPGGATERAVVLTEGQWPGMAPGDGMAGASSGPWVDANLHWVACLRALHPGRPALLGYLPKTEQRLTPGYALELALIEAWAGGGNYLLALEPAFREALLRDDARVRDNWRQLGRTAAFLQQNAERFGRPVSPELTVLVEPGEATPEIANLLFRRCLSPALAPAAEPPAPDGRRCALVALDLQPPPESVRRRILAHAEAGATVAVNGAWWRTSGLKPLRREEDREWFTLGRGRVVAYHDAIDPSAFGYDAIDLVGQERRAARVWSAPAAIALASERQLLVVNYGRPAGAALARVHGHFASARLLRPDAGPLDLRPARRGPGTEVEIPQLSRLAVVLFE